MYHHSGASAACSHCLMAQPVWLKAGLVLGGYQHQPFLVKNDCICRCEPVVAAAFPLPAFPLAAGAFAGGLAAFPASLPAAHSWHDHDCPAARRQMSCMSRHEHVQHALQGMIPVC